jgi:hypothetical protein
METRWVKADDGDSLKFYAYRVENYRATKESLEQDLEFAVGIYDLNCEDKKEKK